MSEIAAAGASASENKAKPRKIDVLRVIAIFKFLKALVLIATSYGAHKLLDTRLLERLSNWTATLADDRVERRLLEHALDWVENLGAKRIQIIVAVTAAYTLVVLIEGIGLWMRRAWAEWLTVIFTASLIPFELWEMIQRPPGHRLTIFVTFCVNALIVAYLIWFIRQKEKQHF